MTKQVQRRRGTATQHTSFTGAEGELSVNTTNKSVHVHDGVTTGGIEAARADMTNVSDADLNARLTGNTLSALTITSADINGGTIDGTVIGGASAAAVTGTTITGSGFVSTGNMSFGDNNKAIFGAGSDLQIYHDGTHSYINDTGAGDLIIRGDNNIWLQTAAAETMARGDANGAFNLYYNNAAKLATTSTGVDVTGTVTADGLTVDGDILVSDGTPSITLSDADGTNQTFTLTHNSATSTFDVRNNTSHGNMLFRSYDGTSYQNKLRLDSTGDISFYEDTGTTPKFFWDASAEALGIGTSSPAVKLEVEADSGASDGSVSAPVAIRITDTLSSQSGTTDTTNPWGALQFYSRDISNEGPIVHAQISTIYDDVYAAGSHLTFSTWDAGNAGAIERLRITSSGNVGIGEPSPNATLHVTSASAVAQRLESTSTAYTRFALENTNADKGVDMTFTTGGVLKGVFGFNGTNMNLDYRNGANLTFSSSATERLRIDASGNVGIGTSAPNADLHISSALPDIRLTDSDDSSEARISYNTAGGNGLIISVDEGNTVASSVMRFHVDGSERLRIDASGNLLVAQSSTTIPGVGNTTVGHSLHSQGYALHSRDNAQSLYVNRNASDGAIIDLRKDGTTVGSIGSYGGTDLTIGTGDTGLRFAADSDKIWPFNTSAQLNSDATVSLGDTNKRFRNLYLSGDGYFGKTTTAAFNTTVGVAIQGSTGYINACRSGGPSAYLNRTTSTGELVALMYDGATKGNISVTASAASFNTTSDYRLKENVVDLTGAADRIKKIQVHRFNFIADPDATVDGFLAHEVQEIVPEAVTGTKDAMRTEEYEVTPAVLDDEGNVVTDAVMGTREVPDYQGIDQSKLVPLLTAALQEALKRIEALEAQLNP